MTLDVPSSSSVPREPTQAMLASAEPINNFELMNRNVWRAMWDAAQSTLATPPTTLVESQGQTHSSEVGPSGAGGSAGTLSTPAASESATPEVREAHPQPHATTGTLPSDVAELCRILRDYEQLDGDGVFVSASRQACDKAATLLEAQAQEIAELVERMGNISDDAVTELKEVYDRAERAEEKIKELEHLKDKKVITVCTGDIRCEKGTCLLKKEGFLHRDVQSQIVLLFFLLRFSTGQ